MSTFFVREKENIKIYGVDEKATTPSPLDSQMSLPFPEVAAWSPQGGRLGLVDSCRGVMVIELSDEAGDITVRPLPGSSTQTKQLHWSAKATFLVSLHPYERDGDTNNMLVWDAATAVAIGRYSFPRWREKQLWPAFKWTPDENLCIRLDGNSLVVADGQSLQNLHVIKADAMPIFEIAPWHSGDAVTTLTVFSPEHRTNDVERTLVAAGYLEIVTLDKNSAKQERVMDVPGMDAAHVEWSASGKAYLFWPEAQVDETGQSYFGASKLFVVSKDGSFQHELTAMEGDKAGEGVVHGVSWSPTADEFVLIQGFQPATASLWSYDAQNGACKKVWTFPERLHRNTIKWNRFGSLLVLGGFGNLAGDLDFWYRDKEGPADKPFLRCGSTKAECTVSCAWAPNGRHFLTAVLAPRMRVDNQVQVWRGIEGKSVHTQRFHELFEASWRPQPAATDLTTEEVAACKASAEAVLSKGVKKAYRPPGQRGEAVNSVAARMLDKDNVDSAITYGVRGRARPLGGSLTGKNGKKGDATPVPVNGANGYPAANGRQRDTTPPSRAHSPEIVNGVVTDNRQKLVASPERGPAPEPKHAPETGWEYLDRNDNVQGPFSVSEMRAWYTHGYFKPELRIRVGAVGADPGAGFTPLQDLYPAGLEAFVQAPRVACAKEAPRRILS